MLKAIFDVITSIGDFFVGLADFVTKLFSDIANFVVALGHAVSFIPTIGNWLPGLISGVIISCLTLAVLFRVIGRE